MSDMQQIVVHYRALAREAEAAAGAIAVGKYRDAYRVMARHWTELAEELELTFGIATLH